MRLIGIVLLAGSLAFAQTPQPLPDHPGNIFLAGEHIVIPVPSDGAWKLTDCDGKSSSKSAKTGKVDLGTLPVGYYELRGAKPETRITLGVIAPLKSPTPPTSPIGLDVAMAWFYKTESEQRAAANLCALAGVNWIRDRLNWAEIEPKRGKFSAKNIYDDTARIQSEAGLRVLQVNHICPPWAGKDANRFPDDLRDVHNFYREMAKRWKGQVLAFEPWNEADIEMFGAHTGSEIAALQKAAFLGLKSGNPDVIACQNVFAVANNEILADFYANRPWPYYDTYNLHHYVGLDRYPAVYAAHRAVSAQKPMWVTECNIPVQWTGDEKLAEPSDADLRTQAERIATVYATSLFEGSVNTFYFLLPHYVEGKTQFGLLHRDLTPRPAYVALAAVGRLLADAKPLAGWSADDPATKGYLFEAMPDGQKKHVLVIWRSAGAKELPFGKPFERVFDHLGRERKDIKPGVLPVSPGPLFVVMRDDGELKPAPAPAPAASERPSPVVLQVVPPRESTAQAQSAYVLPPTQRNEIKVFAYNFSDAAIKGELGVNAPAGWTCEIPTSIEVPPGERKELTLTIQPRAVAEGTHELSIVGTFGPDTIVAAFRVLDERPPAKK